MTEVQRNLPPVPVTILTGFLGAGQTTLLKTLQVSSQNLVTVVRISYRFFA